MRREAGAPAIRAAAREDFLPRYARAREMGWECRADELLAIADDTSRDIRIDADGKEHGCSEAVQRSRLMVETRKWVLARMLPKVYGERLAVSQSDGDELDVKSMSTEQLEAEIAVIRGKREAAARAREVPELPRAPGSAGH